MNPILKNILAVIVGLVIGGMLNKFLIDLGPKIIPFPEGVDVSSPEAFIESVPLFQAKNFIFPFLAHALGALVGAFLTAKIAANNNMKFAIGIGAFFLLGGITMVILAGGPIWFILLDLIIAYIPMAWLGGKLAAGRTLNNQTA